MTSPADATNRKLERCLEWDALAEPRTFELVALPSPPLVEGTRKLTVSRDAELRLVLAAEGVLEDPRKFFAARRAAEDSVPAGTFISPIEAAFEAHGASWRLHGHFDPDPDTSQTAGGPLRFLQTGTLHRMHARWARRLDFTSGEATGFAPLGAPAWRSDWFVNGPQEPISGRQTKRRRNATFKRERAVGRVEIAEAPGGGGSLDHFLVDAGDVRFSVSRVPGGFAPEWCQATSIEYPIPIPDEDVRDGVAEIVSFVIGRRLIPVGSTVFDQAGWSIEEEATTPWGQGIRRLCGRADLPPIRFRQASDEIERVLVDLVPRYLETRKRLRLHDALLSYWLADEAYMAVDLALYGSALEALKNAWFETTSGSRGQYMPETEFKAGLAEPLALLRAKIRESALPEAIANKIEGAWRMGGGEQLRAFLDELPLVLSSTERKAIQARNAPAHGGIRASADFEKLARHANAYRVLFVRAFLKMVGYCGTYIDRTSLHHPSRQVDDPAGGAEPRGSP